VTEPQTKCQLYAVIEAGPGAPERLSAALSAAELACVLVAPAAGRRLDEATAKPLVKQARQAGVTVLVVADAEFARSIGADGVHLGAEKEPQAAYREARELLGNDAVVGGDAGVSRHVAMLLAEAGADYVGFGAPVHLKDRDKGRARRDDLILWWAEVFQVPCVAFDVETADEAGDLAAAGADFVALTLSAAVSPANIREVMHDMTRAIRSNET
jgi:thiamine-phosphate pyrophosphorylase